MNYMLHELKYELYVMLLEFELQVQRWIGIWTICYMEYELYVICYYEISVHFLMCDDGTVAIL